MDDGEEPVPDADAALALRSAGRRINRNALLLALGTTLLLLLVPR